MWMLLVISLGTLHALQSIDSSDNNSMEQYDTSEKHDIAQYEHSDKSKESTQPEQSETPSPKRRWVAANYNLRKPEDEENDRDANLKSKIATLVEQTLHDSARKLRTIQRYKEKHKDDAEYKVGFILSMIKKTRDVLDELFNVAIKHRDDYKALEQLKLFELIVHTNVDTTNLVRQMVEIHIQHMNSTNVANNRNRVILL